MREEVLRLAGPAYTLEEQPGVYVQRLEAACRLLHRKLQPSYIAAAQPVSSGPAAHNAPPPAPPTPSAAGKMAAVELCTLLLADQEVLDVVLALHDIRAAQISKLLPWSPHRHTLYLPMPSKSLDQQLRHSQRSVPGSQLSQFISRLERATRMEGDPLLFVWDSMHRAMLLVLAALQSLPIHPHSQHSDPAATTHTSATPQLPPGYHRCSACLLLTLRLALRLNQFCMDQLGGGCQLLAQLHATMPGLLLGLSTAVSVMQAAGHPEAQAHRLLFLRCILHLGPLHLQSMAEMGWFTTKDIEEQLNVKPTTSCPDHLARLLSSSPAMTGWPGPLPVKPIPLNSNGTAAAGSCLGHTSGSSSSNRSRGRGGVKGRSPGQGCKGCGTAYHKDLAVVNSLAHVAQALCAVLGRQEEGLIMDQLISTCKAEGQESWNELHTDSSCLATAALGVMAREYDCLGYMVRMLSAASAPSRIGAVASGHETTPSAVSSSPLLSVVLSVLPRCLVLLRGTVATVRLGATLDNRITPDEFPGCLRDYCTLICDVLQLMVELWPDGRCRPAMLRLLVRTAAIGAHGYSTMALLLDRAPDYEAEALAPDLLDTIQHVCSVWVLLLMPYSDTEQGLSDMNIRFDDCHPQGQNAKGSAACGRKKVHKLPPSAQQLAPLALDLVWGMEGMLQMMQQHWHMFPPEARVGESSRMCSLFRACCVSLHVLGHVINVLAEPAAVGPAGLAAQPASWLPCGNSLVEGWCSQLLDRVCQLFCINSPDLKGPPYQRQFMGCRALACSHLFLPQVQEQAPTSMSPEVERLLSCLMLVLTVALPLDTWLAVTPSLPADGAEIIEQAIHDLLTCMEAEQVWSWQALAAGTPAEASLASVLQGAANKLQLPHLVAPAPRGWQPGRLTLDRGRGPPEFMRLCFPSL